MLLTKILLWVTVPSICLFVVKSEDEDLLEDLLGGPDPVACVYDKWDELTTRLIGEIDKELQSKCNRAYPHGTREIITTALSRIQNLLDQSDITTSPTTTTTTTTTTPTTKRPTTTSTTQRSTSTTKKATTRAPITTTPKPIIYCGGKLEKKCVKRWNCEDQDMEYEKYLISLTSKGECHYLETCCFHNKTKNRKFLRSTTIETPQWGNVNHKGVYMTLINSSRGESDFGEFPWTVAIFSGPEDFKCAGSLISPGVVLSSASILKRPKPYIARAGDWDMRTENEILPYQERFVKHKEIHPMYSYDTNQNDIALLFLEKPFNLMPHIVPICLPSEKTYDFKNCIVAGWNDVRSLKKKIMTKMALSIERRPEKALTLVSVTGPNSNLKYAVGSALVCPEAADSTQRYYQIGIWSHGFKTSQTKFTYIPNLLNWITSTLTNHEVNPNLIEGMLSCMKISSKPDAKITHN